MPDGTVKFDDGDRYDRMMGVWSRLAGAPFLDWLSPPSGQRWIDVGCGNGAFTELLIKRCQPAKILGVDPSPGLLDYARKRHVGRVRRFEQVPRRDKLQPLRRSRRRWQRRHLAD